MRPKIAFIGAGSVVFAKKLISDILQFPELSDCCIRLMDIDATRLRVAEVMTQKIISKLGVKAICEATTDRREAIRGAKYVICAIQVGGYKPATVVDFEIPKKYGLKQTIADTLGVGGVFRGLRTIPKILEIAQDIKEVAEPECLFINYTNPMAMLCMAVDHTIGIPMVGLCHSVQGTSSMLANFAGLKYEDVTYKVAGINHQAFFLEFKCRGQDAYPILFKLLDDPKFAQEKVRFEMMRRLGYFVTESSEHQSEYVPYFIHHGDEMISKYEIPIDEYLRRCEATLSTWEKTEADLLGPDGDIVVQSQSHEYGSYIIHSMETNRKRVIYGNVPNRDLITNLPHRCCVELPVLVDGNGLQPTHIGELPPQLAAICRTNINVQELTVKAALTLKREHIYHAVMTDPHTAATLTLDKIWEMCDELIEAHQKLGYLPDYSPAKKGTGRSLAEVGDKVFASIVQPDLGEDTRYELLVDNQLDEKFESKIEIKLSEKTKDLAKLEPIPVSVEARKQISQLFTLPETLKDTELTLFATSKDRRLVGQPFERIRQGLFDVPLLKDETTSELTSLRHCGTFIELYGHGEQLATGNLAICADRLYVYLKVNDTKISHNIHQPWEASCLDFRVGKRGPGSGSNRLLLTPQNGGQTLLDHLGNPVPQHKFETTVTKQGYATFGAIDLPTLNIDPKSESFLLSLNISVGALGTAHGACRSEWKPESGLNKGFVLCRAVEHSDVKD